MTASYLTLKDGARLAYHKFAPDSPSVDYGITFLPGYKSDMEGSKALFLQEFCTKHAIPYLRFDYQGHGQSSGKFEDGTISSWTDDTIAILDELIEQPQLLIGSSMGGWIMLLAALARPEKIHALLGIAAAPDFTEDLMWQQFDEEAKNILMQQGVYHLPSEYCNDPSCEPEPYPITRALIEDGRSHLLLKQPSIPIECPVRLLHGMQDQDVPWQVATNLMNKLESNDVSLTLLKDGAHRMSEPPHLQQLARIVSDLLVPNNN